MRKPVIAIDGYSSTGKSSISKDIAKKLDLVHLDTGALYRGITYFGLEHFSSNGLINIAALIKNLEHINLRFIPNGKELILVLNDEDITKKIREPRVSDAVSLVAKQAEIRQHLLESQRSIAENGGVILDGRDIGTVVLPNADYKFFLTASIEERTNRRYEELKSSNQNIQWELVKQNLIERDKTDSEREISPLRQAEDAVLIDNTNLTKEQTIEKILDFIT